VNAGLNEAVTGIEVVKATAQEAQELRKFSVNARRFRDLSVRNGQIQARYIPPLLLTVATVGAFLHGVLLVSRGELNVGGLLAAAAAIVLDFEGDLVALVEGRHAAPLESGGVYEDVLAAVLRLNEAEAARMIEEFHCAVNTSHREFPFPLKFHAIGPGAPKGVLRRLEISGKVVVLLGRDSHFAVVQVRAQSLGRPVA
jgi:ABC-type multidrug transport system fused ATPase/permease subunit